MKTKIFQVHSLPSAAVQEAAEVIKKGGLAAFPTETVYGLGANGLDAEASAGIYQAKGRPSDNPLILHISSMEMLAEIAAEIPPVAKKIMTAFCPGPVTLILKRTEKVPLSITGGLDTVGVRMPDHDIARALIAAAGVPIAAPSANISGRPSPTTAEAVAADMDGRIDVILDGGACSFGVESTIVDCTAEIPTILRPGAVTWEMLTEVLGEVRIDPALAGEKTVPKAPGMKYTHYAPKAPLTLIEGAPEQMAAAFSREIERLQQTGKRPGVIVSAETAKEIACSDCYIYGPRTDTDKIAASLYEALRSFDSSPVDVLLAEGVSEEGLGLAIMNRLHKASGFRSIFI